MLDDLRLMHERDVQDALGATERQWQQLLDDRRPEVVTAVSTGPISNVVYAGMGSSAQAGLLARSWLDLPVPFEVLRDYDIPTYVGRDTLFVAVSYSGNNQEVLSALEQASSRGARVAVITSGGWLAEIAKERKYALAIVPAGGQSRTMVFGMLQALTALLSQVQLADEAALTAEMTQAAELLKTAVQEWLPTVPTSRNPAKQLALELIGKSIAIYAGPKLSPAAYKWKTDLNENAKQLAWCGQYPEFAHNELIGWTKQPVDKPYAVVELGSSLENPEIQKQFMVSERLLSGLRPAPLVITAQGDNLLEQLLWTTVFGGFASVYVALLNGVNPTPIDLIATFKQQMEV